MFLRNSMKTFTGAYSKQIERLKHEIETADAIVIGAGAGLSAAAGFDYSGERFQQLFGDFEEKYGFHDMYSGGFYPYNTLEEHWAYWSRYIYYNRFVMSPKPTYENLLDLVKEKDYFVITTNVDHCFQKSGFDKKRLFYTQGDYGLFQCSEPCCNETFDNEDIIKKMMEEQKNMSIPSGLIPLCPHCGKPLTMNLRSDDRFVEDKGWHNAAARYDNFLKGKSSRHILLLELGVGYNTPIVIKYPFWQMASGNTNSVYACINSREAFCPNEIADRAICVKADIDKVINSLKEC